LGWAGTDWLPRKSVGTKKPLSDTKRCNNKEVKLVLGGAVKKGGQKELRMPRAPRTAGRGGDAKKHWRGGVGGGLERFGGVRQNGDYRHQKKVLRGR